MNSAQKVIDLFGGQSALATLLGKRQSTVQYWSKSGLIPPKWHAPLLQLAEQRGVPIDANSFVVELVAGEPEIEDIDDDGGDIPVAKWWGTLALGGAELPCYVLDDGRRIISRNGATGILTSGKGGGNLESYLRVEALKPFLAPALAGQMIEFSIETVVNKTVRGIEAETFIEICRAYVTAFEKQALATDRQRAIAIRCAMFLAACAKVGLIALIDEATGYQFDRPDDALQFKLKVFLEEEMRKWEPTFPNDLWLEFGRLTNWKGSVHHRPKYWGKLVMELVYENLDKDVADWLRKNAPKPQKGQNYHQWLSSQYGLKRLIEHLWMLVGMARACDSIKELRSKVAEQFGRNEVQLSFLAPPPAWLKRRTPPQIDAGDVIDTPGNAPAENP